ncbi:MAG: hypothetical protein AMK69_28580 [Nitrospira bacterium SG8_3]|nr:MAG: hypothetical protein AMK69_28580 [Nitrospira bacterium SG8_3]
MRGTEKRARISIKLERKLPSKSADENAYFEIVDLVKKAGVWEEESTLNTRKLARDLESGNLPDKLAKKLQKMIFEEESARIYLSNLKEGDERDE